MIELKKAQRKRAKLRLGIAAPSGGGKTLGALLLAYGMMKELYSQLSDEELWAKIAVIDSESGSGDLYVGYEVNNLKIGEYNTITLDPPFEATKYTQSIEICEKAGIEVIIIDSTSHLWAGEGGLLEQQGLIAKRTGNSYTAWRDITPQHNNFIDKMLQSSSHIIATMRSKQEYVQEKNDQGKTIVRKLGLNPVQRDGMEYEFTIFLEIDAQHNAFGSKDRTGLVDQKYFVITPEVGERLMRWLESGTDNPTEVIAKTVTVEELQESVIELCREKGGTKNKELMKLLKKYDKSGNPNRIKDKEKLQELLDKLQDVEKLEEKEEESTDA